MTTDEMREAIAQVGFPDYQFHISVAEHGDIYLQAAYNEADTVTGEMQMQTTRKWVLSPWMSKSEVVSTAFKCVLTSMEHRTREWFTYRGRAIYQPHYDVDVLHSVCEHRSVTMPSGLLLIPGAEVE